jgi:hypothetical protein
VAALASAAFCVRVDLPGGRGSVLAWIVNCTDAGCASDVGHRILTTNAPLRHPHVALMVRFDVFGNRWVVSARSHGESGQARRVAEAFDGAGHDDAAGFTLHGVASLDLLLRNARIYEA